MVAGVPERLAESFCCITVLPYYCIHVIERLTPAETVLIPVLLYYCIIVLRYIRSGFCCSRGESRYVLIEGNERVEEMRRFCQFLYYSIIVILHIAD